MQSQVASPQTDGTPRPTIRLHYLDWLRVLAILSIFIFHS